MQSGKQGADHPTRRGNNGFISHDTQDLLSGVAGTVQDVADAGATLLKAGVVYTATNAPGAIQSGVHALDRKIKSDGPYALRYFNDTLRSGKEYVSTALAEGFKYASGFIQSKQVDAEVELTKLHSKDRKRATSLDGRGEYYKKSKNQDPNVVRTRSGTF